MFSPQPFLCVWVCVCVCVCACVVAVGMAMHHNVSSVNNCCSTHALCALQTALPFHCNFTHRMTPTFTQRCQRPWAQGGALCSRESLQVRASPRSLSLRFSLLAAHTFMACALNLPFPPLLHPPFSFLFFFLFFHGVLLPLPVLLLLLLAVQRCLRLWAATNTRGQTTGSVPLITCGKTVRICRQTCATRQNLSTRVRMC